jgi:small subunit ribosomal protein S16
MLKIRLQRVGRKHIPTFRVVLTDSKNAAKSGRFQEILGAHDPRNEKDTKFNGARIKELISNGAQVSETLHNLLVTHKVITGKKINVLPKKTPQKKEVATA